MKRFFLFVAALLLLAADAAAAAVPAGGGLIYCSERKIYQMNPQRHPVSSMASTLSFAVYDRLLAVNPLTRGTKSSAGTLERVYDNETVYVFSVAGGIRFHSNRVFTPTRELNAYDVEFSFDRLINPANPFYRPPEDFPYLTNMDILDNLVSVKAVSKRRVEFRLKEPSNLLLPFLATDNSVILSREYADAILERGLPVETIDQYAIGSGPYRQAEFLRGRYVKLKAFEGYHGRKPRVRSLALTNSFRSNKLLYKLITGECHITSNPSANQIMFLQRMPKDFNIVQKNTVNGTFIVYNTRKPYLSTGVLRRTLSSLFSLADLNTTVFFNQGRYIAELFDEDPEEIMNNPGGDGGAGPAPDDGSAVRRLTAEEYGRAYNALREREIEITIFQSSVIANTAHSKIAQFLRSSFARHGIRTKIRAYRGNQGLNRLKKGQFDMAIVNVFSDSENLIYPMISCRKSSRRRLRSNINSFENYTGWCSDAIESLYDGLAGLDANDEEAARIRKRIMNILINEMPVYPLLYNLSQYVALPGIKGLETTPYGGISFVNARIENPGSGADPSDVYGAYAEAPAAGPEEAPAGEAAPEGDGR